MPKITDLFPTDFLRYAGKMGAAAARALERAAQKGNLKFTERQSSQDATKIRFLAEKERLLENFFICFKPFCCWCQEPIVNPDPVCQCGHPMQLHDEKRNPMYHPAYRTAIPKLCEECPCSGFFPSHTGTVKLTELPDHLLNQGITYKLTIPCHGEARELNIRLAYALKEIDLYEPVLIALSQLFETALRRPYFFQDKLKGGPMKILATLIYDEMLDIWRVRTPYHPDWVAEVKSRIPPPARKWVKEDQTWLIDPMFMEVIKELCEQYFDGYHESRPNLAAPTLANEASCYRNFVTVIPKDLLKKLYREASLALHPDKGGSTASMSALNVAWDALKKELKL